MSTTSHTTPPTKSLLLALARNLPPGYAAPARPTEELRTMCWRTYRRDLAKIGITGPVAETLIQRTLAALSLALNDPAVTPDDQQAACLVAERVLVAVASTLVAAWAAAMASESDAGAETSVTAQAKAIVDDLIHPRD